MNISCGAGVSSRKSPKVPQTNHYPDESSSVHGILRISVRAAVAIESLMSNTLNLSKLFGLITVSYSDALNHLG